VPPGQLLVEGRQQLDDLRGADEAFLASTTREVQPASAIDSTALTAPGPVTSRAMAAVSVRIQRELDAG